MLCNGPDVQKRFPRQGSVIGHDRFPKVNLSLYQVSDQKQGLVLMSSNRFFQSCPAIIMVFFLAAALFAAGCTSGQTSTPASKGDTLYA